ncbi:hypothetical protein LCGC14_0289050 [marine sediment metagenome]|uniref:Uncharacterized protein n=1 Tax=marine sediment metagenome TaxID=412755 RepID=A0A0F9WZE4_9ZZZZ
MSQKKPNSDRSKRATERMAARTLSKATNVAARAKAVLTKMGGAVPRITNQDLMARIGALTLERDYWKERAETLEQELVHLLPTNSEEEGETEEEGPPVGETVD